MDLPLSFLHGMKLLALPYKDVVLSGDYLPLFLVAVGALLLLAYYIADMVPVPGQRQAYGRSYTYRAATTGMYCMSLLERVILLDAHHPTMVSLSQEFVIWARNGGFGIKITCPS